MAGGTYPLWYKFYASFVYAQASVMSCNIFYADVNML